MTVSDTHVPDGAGWGINLVADHARKAGYSQRVIFRKREHHLIDFAEPDSHGSY